MLPGTSRAPIRPFQLFFYPLTQHAFVPVPVSWCCYSCYHVCLKSCARCLWPRCMKRHAAWGGRSGGPGWDMALDGGRHRGSRVLDPPLRAALTGADSLNCSSCQLQVHISTVKFSLCLTFFLDWTHWGYLWSVGCGSCSRGMWLLSCWLAWWP